ncbi:MAG: AzlC family ABC transporter permease [Treponema sp.]|nr:AzlC family ABC transporter permease [Treponema sp.]
MRKVFLEGLRDGVPIGLGYLAVAFSLGIVARNAGLTPIQGFIASFFNLASAGEYALFTSMQTAASFLEIALITLVVNARYLLMSCALAQRFDPATPMIHRLGVGFGITDELFGIAIARPGTINPFYSYGAFFVAIPLWSIGTSLGIIAGNFLPVRVVSALSVALYGMFLAIIIPPAKKNLTIAIAVAVSFLCSYICGIIPYVKELSSGTRTIILTVVIASIVALIKPIEDTETTSGPSRASGPAATSDNIVAPEALEGAQEGDSL